MNSYLLINKSTAMRKNLLLLFKFTNPIRVFLSSEDLLLKEHKDKEDEFIRNHEGEQFETFISNVEKEFGLEVRLTERILHLKYLRNIKNMLLFFVILTCLSIIAYVFHYLIV